MISAAKIRLLHMLWGLLACAMAFMAPAFADLPCDVDASGAVDAVDVQLVINGALRLDTRPYFTDVDSSGAIDAMDVQLAINAALRLAVVLPPRINVFTLGQGQVVVDPAAETYAAGTVVTLTPAPGVGWLFDHWEGDLSGADNPASVTVTAPMNIFAVFVQVGQQGLASQHIAQLQSTAPRLGWTFTVGETDAAGYPFTSITGLIPPPPGYQDGAKKMTIPDTKVALPAAFDWRDQGKVSPIRDQGYCGSCWAFATMGAFESAKLIQTGQGPDLSEQWLVSCNQSGWGCGGGWFAGDYLVSETDHCGNLGAPGEAAYAYTSGASGATGSCQCNAGVARHIATSWSYVTDAFSLPTVAQIKQAIYTHGPVAAGVAANAAFQAYTGGVFNDRTQAQINHAIIIVGWDDSLGRNGAWILRNSWNTSWGINGYMYIEYGSRNVGYAANYIDCTPPSNVAPTVTSFAIDNGSAATSSRDVTLNNVCTGSPTQYMASELQDFSDTTWQAYSATPSFTLSTGNGAKTVYFKVKNDAGESGVSSDAITLNEPTAAPAVTRFSINNNAAETISRTVTLNNVCAESPTHYMASESSDFSGASWQTYLAVPSFTLSTGNGAKTVYFKVKNGAGESGVSTDTITLNERAGTEETVLLPGGVPLVMVWIPGGTFMMGRYPGEQDSGDSEDSLHQVTVPGFWMAKYELTKRQWVAVMGTTPWSGEDCVLGDLDSPAVFVSWDDAKLFSAMLNGLTGKPFRLPSESQWEYACRAGTTTRFYWGDDPGGTVINDYAWYYYNAFHVDENYAHVVGLKLPNGFGLYDMSGNVREWCADDFHWDYSGAPTDGSAWVDSPRASSRMLRGGGWGHYGNGCRSAGRDGCFPTVTAASIGFRLVVAADMTSPSVSSFAIDNNAAETASRTVRLNNACTNNPTHYMASESSDFSGALWLEYATNPLFTLSSGNEVKTVYFKVKNDAGESAAVSDTITLNVSAGTEETILLPGRVPLVMVWIPDGTFLMGRYPGEQDSSDWEDSQHQVTLSGFWMGKYELTKRQWVAVMGSTPWVGQSYVLNDLDSPAVYVSWDDAQAFITALNGLTGRTFRLPSESEWEYACRAGTTTRFYWGDDPGCTLINDYAWWYYNAGDVADQQYAHVVGSKLPNAWGLYDMSGNVWEWCEDDWHSSYTGALADGNPWVDSPRGLSRVFRGGSWISDNNCRSANRSYGSPDHAHINFGFRLAW